MVVGSHSREEVDGITCLFYVLYFNVSPSLRMMPGYSTRTLLSGDTGAFRRVDQFFLAERYEIDCDVERLCEMLRYIYQAHCLRPRYAGAFKVRHVNVAAPCIRRLICCRFLLESREVHSQLS